MASISLAKNAINLVASKCDKIVVTTSGTLRGSKNPIVVPDNCIFVYMNGSVVVNNPRSPELNFIVEGGKSEWEGAVTNDNIFPYFSPSQMTTLTTLINYSITLNKNLYIESDLFIL